MSAMRTRRAYGEGGQTTKLTGFLRCPLGPRPSRAHGCALPSFEGSASGLAFEGVPGSLGGGAWRGAGGHAQGRRGVEHDGVSRWMRPTLENRKDGSRVVGGLAAGQGREARSRKAEVLRCDYTFANLPVLSELADSRRGGWAHFV